MRSYPRRSSHIEPVTCQQVNAPVKFPVLKGWAIPSGTLTASSLLAAGRDADGCALEVCKITRAWFTILQNRVNINLIISVLSGF